MKKGSNEYNLLKQEIKRLRELRELDQGALRLQRKEYKRRLKILNGEHQNIKDNQAKSVLREIYDTEQTEQDKKISTLVDWKNNTEGKQATAKYFSLAALVISAVSLILWIIKNFNN